MKSRVLQTVFAISLHLPLGIAWAGPIEDATFSIKKAKDFCNQVPSIRFLTNEPGEFLLLGYKGWLLDGMKNDIEKGRMTPEKRKAWDIALNVSYSKYYNYVMSNCPY